MKESYPNLFANTIETRKKERFQHEIEIAVPYHFFLVHLHYSVQVHNTASRFMDEPAKQFNFATFPQLVDYLNELREVLWHMVTN